MSRFLQRSGRLFTQLLSRDTAGGARNFSTASLRYAPAQILDGKKIALDVRKEVKVEVEKWVAAGNRAPHLTVVLVGNNPASESYVSSKTKAAAKAGITAETILQPDTISQQELLELVESLNQDAGVDGILVQLPVPEHIDERTVCDSVSPQKDVDGFHVKNVGRFCLDVPALLPATPYGVLELIARYGIETHGKNVVVCGRSKNVGMPISMMLHSDKAHASGMGGDATVTICHRYTPPEQLKAFCRTADIIIVGVGIPGLIRADMVKEGAVVIDIGINRVPDDANPGKFKLVGDVDYEGVSKVASYITPVPGGVGPMTVAMLMKNTLMAARKDIKF